MKKTILFLSLLLIYSTGFAQTGTTLVLPIGHTDGINSVSFSPDGKFALSGSSDKTLKLWDIASGKEIKTLIGHNSFVSSVSFSPDRKQILSGSFDGTVKLWDMASGKEIKTFIGHTDRVTSVSFSPDGKYALSGSNDKTLKLWDIASGNEIKTFMGHSDILFSISFSPDGKYALSGSRDKTVKLWDIASGKEIKTFIGHTDQVYSVSFSPDGKYALSGSGDGTIKLWDINSGKEIKTFIGHTMHVESVSFSPAGKYVLSGSGDRNIKLWDINSGKEIKTFMGHTDWVISVSFSPDGKYALSGSTDKTVKLWDIASGKEIKTFMGHTNGVLSVFFSPDGKYALSASDDNTTKLWDIESRKELCSLISVDQDDWLVVTPDGRFDGSEYAMKMLYYVKGLDIIPLASLYEQYYTPKLLARIMSGEKFEKPELNINDVKLPPLVKITSPQNKANISAQTLTVTVEVTDQGGGIDEVVLFHNGKLVETTNRGFKPVPQTGTKQTKTWNISLTTGENRIKASAFSQQRTEAMPHEITVTYQGAKASANLYLFVIGVNEYKNPKYKLNYAVADAMAFKTEMEKGSGDIFGKVETIFLQDAKVTRASIIEKFNYLKTNIKQEDVFIFYYAGHGVMSEDKNSQFYIVPFDVTQLYTTNAEMMQTAIAASELQTFSKDLKAQKQLFVFDACQSGGLVEMLASRGAAEERAIAMLARSTGTYWIAASGSQQFATEFKELGHGLFTYTILQGLQGNADGSNDKQITVEELLSYVKIKLPIFSEKYKGEVQYPTSFGYGNDFPIIMVK